MISEFFPSVFKMSALDLAYPKISVQKIKNFHAFLTKNLQKFLISLYFCRPKNRTGTKNILPKIQITPNQKNKNPVIKILKIGIKFPLIADLIVEKIEIFSYIFDEIFCAVKAIT